jgi:hypothetical protein
MSKEGLKCLACAIRVARVEVLGAIPKKEKIV